MRHASTAGLKARRFTSLRSGANSFSPASVTPPQITTTSGLRSEEHTSELQSHSDLVCRLLLEKKKEKENGRLPGVLGGLPVASRTTRQSSASNRPPRPQRRTASRCEV